MFIWCRICDMKNLNRSHSNRTELPWIMPNSSSASWGDTLSKLTNIHRAFITLRHLHKTTHHRYTHKYGNIIQCDGHFTKQRVKSIRLRLPPFHECGDNKSTCPSVGNASQPLQYRLMNIRNKTVIRCVIIPLTITQFCYIRDVFEWFSPAKSVVSTITSTGFHQDVQLKKKT